MYLLIKLVRYRESVFIRVKWAKLAREEGQDILKTISFVIRFIYMR